MKKKILVITLCFTLISLLSIFIANKLVEDCSKFTYNTVSDIPKNKVGLLLGTSKHVRSGHQNLYYKYRIEATISLYKSGKIEYVLISGDNSRSDYDEPSDMKNDLVKNGIPEERIFLDYAGFRTLDSVVRAKEIFGQNEVTIISQQFHNERAIYIAKHKGIKAVGFNSRNVSKKYGLRVMLREKLARVKVVLDLIFNVQPKFLGQQITI